ncbi:hypothetical protein [Pseudonocardia sp. KRD291]|uniref:hypothetical protein n=1 Tax=Pseudonocardia sp. KRD291 TaxID=2792007 RepID=UPI001C4A4ABA|nr:hypothetical protein [Pseudonocardia sp. KRD291]MBW0102755.1 hypothetical protein [Pseudonocardia sp. KRD291]
MATLVGALVTAGLLSFAPAAPAEPSATAAPTMSVAPGPTVAELIPAPPLPARLLPELPLPTPEPESEPESTSGATDRCGDRAWWESRGEGDPSDYVAACGTWPSWVDRGETTCVPDEQDCPATTSDASGAAPYTGPTEGRPWSPAYGYYEGRTDGPKNSSGEPCMQGRDNNDPNC